MGVYDFTKDYEALIEKNKSLLVDNSAYIESFVGYINTTSRIAFTETEYNFLKRGIQPNRSSSQLSLHQIWSNDGNSLHKKISALNFYLYMLRVGLEAKDTDNKNVNGIKEWTEISKGSIGSNSIIGFQTILKDVFGLQKKDLDNPEKVTEALNTITTKEDTVSIHCSSSERLTAATKMLMADSSITEIYIDMKTTVKEPGGNQPLLGATLLEFIKAVQSGIEAGGSHSKRIFLSQESYLTEKKELTVEKIKDFTGFSEGYLKKEASSNSNLKDVLDAWSKKLENDNEGVEISGRQGPNRLADQDKNEEQTDPDNPIGEIDASEQQTEQQLAREEGELVEGEDTKKQLEDSSNANQSQIDNLAEKIKALQKSLEDAANEKEELQKRLEEGASSRHELERALDMLREDNEVKIVKIEELEEKLTKKAEEAKKLLKDFDSNSSEVKNLVGQIDELTKKLELLEVEKQKAVEASESIKDAAELKINQATEQLITADSEIEQLKRLLISEKETSSGYAEALEIQKRTLEEQNQDVSEKERRIGELEAATEKMDELKSSVERLSREKEDIKINNSKQREALTSLEVTLGERDEVIDSLNKKDKEAEEKIQGLQIKIQDLTEINSELNEDVAKKTNEVIRLEKKLGERKNIVPALEGQVKPHKPKAKRPGTQNPLTSEDLINRDLGLKINKNDSQNEKTYADLKKVTFKDGALMSKDDAFAIFAICADNENRFIPKGQKSLKDSIKTFKQFNVWGIVKIIEAVAANGGRSPVIISEKEHNKLWSLNESYPDRLFLLYESEPEKYTLLLEKEDVDVLIEKGITDFCVDGELVNSPGSSRSFLR